MLHLSLRHLSPSFMERLQRCLTLAVLISCLCLARSASADSRGLDVAWPDTDSLAINAYFEVLEDPSRTVTLAAVQQTELAARFMDSQARPGGLNFSYSRSAWWLRLRLHNSSDQAIERLLEIRWPALSSVAFHQLGADGAWQTVQTGNALPFSTRQHANRYFVFSVNLQPRAEQVVYLRMESVSTVGALGVLWKPKAFQAYERDDYLTQGALFGTAASLILFNLLLFAAFGDAIYLMYVVYGSLMVVSIADHTGMAKEFLWPQATQWANISKFTFYALTFTAFILFMRRMLDTPRVCPRHDRVLQATAGLFLLCPIAYLISFQSVSKTAVVLHIAGIAVIMATGIYCAWQRQRSAYFFVVAFVGLAAGVMMGSLRGLGLVPSSMASINGMQLGSTLEMLLLAFALADRFNQIRKQKVEAEQAAFLAKSELVDVLQSSGEQLEAQVSERTLELGNSNLELISAMQQLKSAQSELITSRQRAVHGESVALRALAQQHQFAAMVSHEFRSPLTVIDAASQLLASKLPADAEAQPALARIRRGVARLVAFLESCLTADVLDSDRMNLHPSCVDLTQLARKVVQDAGSLSADRPITLEIAPPLGTLQADPYLLSLLLLNLLDNAIKYSPAGSPVTLRVSRAGVLCVFEVIDQGSGIATEDVPIMFRRYHRGASVGTVPGAGLGLSVVRQIVGRHGGDISFQRELPQGTRVVIKLVDVAVDLEVNEQ